MKTTNRGSRIAAFVAAGALAVFSLGLLAAGAAFLWADGQKDANGYITSDTDRFATTTRALATENVDVPIARTFPSTTSSCIAESDSSIGVAGSGRCIWYRSIQSVRSRRSEPSTASRM